MTETARYSILLVTHSYPPVLGGSEVEAQRVCRALRERGHKVKVLCAAHELMPVDGEWVDPYGTPVRVIGKRNASLRGLDLSFALGVVGQLWRERQSYDLVYFLMQGLHLAIGLPVARLLGKPIVMKISGSGIVGLMQKNWMGRLELQMLERWAQKVMILNEGIEAEAVGAGISRERLEWMPNPVDETEFYPVGSEAERFALRQELGLPQHTPLGIFVGRLAPEKELGSLLSAMRILKAGGSKMELLLIGDGPQAGELRAFVSEAGLESKVHFLGRQPMGKVQQYLRVADVFTLVSSLEGFPCSLTEAMVSGLPSVVSRISANEQLIEEGVHGLLVPVGDAAGIARSLERLCLDRELRGRMGAEARRLVVENYSSTPVMVRYERMFEGAMAEKRP